MEGVWGKLFKVRYHRRLLVFPTILLAQGASWPTSGEAAEKLLNLTQKKQPSSRRTRNRALRANTKCSPVVLDEYLERKSVDAVLRQEREKETEETDPFLQLSPDPADPSL